jgi:hypothetical protein
VSKVALAMFLDGDLKTLKVYRGGNRSDPSVIAYFEREGLGDLIKCRLFSTGHGFTRIAPGAGPNASASS